MRIAIVGGGVSGLYIAYKLLKNNDSKHQIDIYEKSDRLGGRVRSVAKDGRFLEAGAGRINKNHRRFWKLLRELGLDHETIRMPTTTDTHYRKDGKTQRKNRELLRDVIKKMGSSSTAFLKSVTLDFFLRRIYPDSTVDDIIYGFGYDSEFINISAYESLMSIKRDLSEENVFYVFKNGIENVIRALENKILATGRANIYLNREIKDIEGDLAGYDKVVVCGTDRDLAALNIRTDAIGVPLARVYAKFSASPAGGVWFKHLPRTTTNNQLRQFIPVDYQKGIAMASYCTNRWADNWKALMTHKHLLQECLMDNLRKTFPECAIPEPEWLEVFYWETGAHSWIPRQPNVKYYKSEPGERVLLSGEVVSRNHHGWIEGALESADETLRSLVPKRRIMTP